MVCQEEGIGLRDYVVRHWFGGRGSAAVAGTSFVQVRVSDDTAHLGSGGIRLDGAVGVVFEA